MNYELRIKSKGFTLIEVIVGIALAIIVFFGIIAGFLLGLKIIDQAKNKVSALAIASGEIEKIKNLPYEEVGISGAMLPNASGTLESTTTAFINNKNYYIERKIIFVTDNADGLASPQDTCYLDYKDVEVKVSWLKPFYGEVKLSTKIMPKDKVQEIQSCQSQPGGILSVSVFDAYGARVESPLIEIKNPLTGQVVAFANPSDGIYDFPLPTSTYRVVVSKSGYSIDRTYGTDEVTTPYNPDLHVIKDAVNGQSFQIDRVSSFSVDTLSPVGVDYFADSFSDGSKISTSSDVLIANNEVTLSTTTEGYVSNGYFFSVNILPNKLINWDKFSFSDSESASNDLKYQIFYASGTDWILIPDSALPQNSIGFDVSPVDISSLSTTTYPQLKIKANFSTFDSASTPVLYDWQISWINNNPTPIPNVNFNLKGDKKIGTNAQGDFVYKNFMTTSSDNGGHINLNNLEWDNYTFSLPTSSALNIIATDPSLQPIFLAPNSSMSIKLFLEAQNSLLVTVQDKDTLGPIFAATTTLVKGSTSTVQFTDSKGQTLFEPISAGNYILTLEHPYYDTTSTSINISGHSYVNIKMKSND